MVLPVIKRNDGGFPAFRPADPPVLRDQGCEQFLAGPDGIVLDSIPFLCNAQDIDILAYHEERHANRPEVVKALRTRLQANDVGGATITREDENDVEIIILKPIGYDKQAGKYTLVVDKAK